MLGKKMYSEQKFVDKDGNPIKNARIDVDFIMVSWI